jgi:hypothetical protein
MTTEEIKSKVLPVLKEYDVSRASLFGSVVRSEATEESDIDLLVEFKGGKASSTLPGLR